MLEKTGVLATLIRELFHRGRSIKSFWVKGTCLKYMSDQSSRSSLKKASFTFILIVSSCVDFPGKLVVFQVCSEGN